ncbi:hypothetical protein CBL_10907 [Carabus blaptoides fortunei]
MFPFGVTVVSGTLVNHSELSHINHWAPRLTPMVVDVDWSVWTVEIRPQTSGNHAGFDESHKEMIIEKERSTKFHRIRTPMDDDLFLKAKPAISTDAYKLWRDEVKEDAIGERLLWRLGALYTTILVRSTARLRHCYYWCSLCFQFCVKQPSRRLGTSIINYPGSTGHGELSAAALSHACGLQNRNKVEKNTFGSLILGENADSSRISTALKSKFALRGSDEFICDLIEGGELVGLTNEITNNRWDTLRFWRRKTSHSCEIPMHQILLLRQKNSSNVNKSSNRSWKDFSIRRRAYDSPP